MGETLLRGLKLLVILPAMAALVLAPLPALAQEAPPAEPQQEAPLSDEVIHTPDPADDMDQDDPDAPEPGVVSPPAPGGAIAGRYVPPDGRALDDRIRASAAAAQGLQGPMDGGWTVRSSDGRALFGLQFSDPVGGSLEGAWRDLRRPGAANARGVIAGLFRTGGELMIRFFPIEGGDPVVLQLTGYSDDVWGGSLWEASGGETAVSVTRNEPRPVVDYASGNYSTRPAGEWRPRPTASAAPSRAATKAAKGTAKGKAKGGKGSKAGRKGASGKASAKAKKGGRGAAPQKTTKKKKKR